ncbi:hypothetical protein LCGC14_0267610 [marine sediment metagenome]|uniref:Uncharacterized protein n=1 Tax=marine sediment metagenome TaxID=412755 RepID=A0A0F9U027_9ZZZZ
MSPDDWHETHDEYGNILKHKDGKYIIRTKPIEDVNDYDFLPEEQREFAKSLDNFVNRAKRGECKHKLSDEGVAIRDIRINEEDVQAYYTCKRCDVRVPMKFKRVFEDL